WRGCEKAVLHQEIGSCDKNFVTAPFFCTNTEKLLLNTIE
ncbi:hypothetical protein HMPREF1345_01291, partial [Enterococcus faecium TX1337RF]